MEYMLCKYDKVTQEQQFLLDLAYGGEHFEEARRHAEARR